MNIDWNSFRKRIEKLKESTGIYRYIIIEGFLLFEPGMVDDLIQKRIYVCVDKETCRERRARGIWKDLPTYFEDILWPSFLHHNSHVLENASNYLFIDGRADPRMNANLVSSFVKHGENETEVPKFFSDLFSSIK